ncbi:cytochrome b subunit of formate dehydrogenase [Streptomyces albogriseolus]
MPPRADAPPAAATVRRFAPAQRWAHRATALLMGVCVATAACLYVPQLAQLAGRRALVVTLHQWSGLLLPVPVSAALVSRAFRADLARLNRFGPHDRVWLRAALRRDRRPASRPAEKFNAGQKLYAAWIAGATLVMLGTGLLMWFTHPHPAGLAHRRDLRPRLAGADRRHRPRRARRHGPRRPRGPPRSAHRLGPPGVGRARAPPVAALNTTAARAPLPWGAHGPP